VAGLKPVQPVGSLMPLSKRTLKSIHVEYYALLREERGLASESVQTGAETPAVLYAHLRERHGLSPRQETLMVAVNDAFGGWGTPLRDGDAVGFLPPVSGG